MSEPRLLNLFQTISGRFRYRRDQKKVDELNRSPGNKIEATSDPEQIKKADFVIIAVPTPLTKAKDPDLGPVISASEIVGRNLKKGAIVVLESTVNPGVTEEIVAPILERESGLVCGKNLRIGYSPERINPGDEEHTLPTITKIVAGMDKATLDTLAELYGLFTTVYRAPDIRTAEAAKVIENVQRDLNIALMNELSMIFARLGLDMDEVLRAAGTNWNFHTYKPALSGATASRSTRITLSRKQRRSATTHRSSRAPRSPANCVQVQ